MHSIKYHRRLEFDQILYGDTVTDPGFGQMGSHIWSTQKMCNLGSGYNMGMKIGVQGGSAPGCPHPGSTSDDSNCLGDIHRGQCIPTPFLAKLKL